MYARHSGGFCRSRLSKGEGRRTTPLANELIANFSGEADRDEEWEESKTRVLPALRNGGADDYADLVRDILTRVPTTRSPLTYAGEMITVLLLNLYAAKIKFGPRSPLGMVLKNTAPLVPIS